MIFFVLLNFFEFWKLVISRALYHSTAKFEAYFQDVGPSFLFKRSAAASGSEVVWSGLVRRPQFLAQIFREERRLEKKVLEFQKELDAARKAARALGHTPKCSKNRKRMSVAGRRAIAKAQRRRWAAVREAHKAAD
jgi:hypothetical protein